MARKKTSATNVDGKTLKRPLSGLMNSADLPSNKDTSEAKPYQSSIKDSASDDFVESENHVVQAPNSLVRSGPATKVANASILGSENNHVKTPESDQTYDVLISDYNGLV